MKFNFTFGNIPANPHTHFVAMSVFEDMTKCLKLALESLGHHVVFNKTYVDPAAINIFMDRFHRPDDAIALKKRGYKYALICTENIVEEGKYNPFEYDETQSAAHYQSFAISASNAAFVWYVLPSAEATCRKLNANSHLLTFGHIDGYAELSDPLRRRAEFDFLISGEETDRRRAIAADLHARGFTVYMSGFDPGLVRVSLMERARIALAIRKTERHPVFSIGRAYHAIMNRTPIIMDYDDPPPYLGRYCTVVPPGEFLASCAGFARRNDLPAYAQGMYDAFAREMPMAPLMRQLLESSLTQI